MSNNDTKKKIYQEIQSIKDLCKNASLKIANFNKTEIYDNDIQIQASENNKVFLNQMIGKFTTLLDSKNIENFVDIKKFETFHNIKTDKIKNTESKTDKDFPHEIKNYHFMKNEELNDFDIKNGFKVKVNEDYKFLNILPENMLKLQENGITFYYCYNKYDDYKIIYIYHCGGDKNYWLGSDNYLYYVDDENNLVIGEYKKSKQAWKFIN